MSAYEIEFKNLDGLMLSARLELPQKMHAHTYAIFAHCFAGSKNLIAAKMIAKALNNYGIGVLSFDFTGLNESNEVPEKSSVSASTSDIVCAYDYLEKHYRAPAILIGHSLGGAAVISAANQLESIRSLVTIGAPSDLTHVQHLFQEDLSKIEKNGSANVTIGSRKFCVKNEFILDLEKQKMRKTLKMFRKPLLLIHSPQDFIIDIQNAQEIYENAHHPKSFISLDGSDHFLSSKSDAQYVGLVIAGWVSRYIEIPEIAPIERTHQAVVSLGNEGYTSEVVASGHEFIADEPESLGGNNFGPSPFDLLASGLGACTVMTLRMYADLKKWDLQKVIAYIDHSKEDKVQEDGSTVQVDHFQRELEIVGDLDEKQRERLLQIANRCPVHKTLSASSVISTALKN